MARRHEEEPPRRDVASSGSDLTHAPSSDASLPEDDAEAEASRTGAHAAAGHAQQDGSGPVAHTQVGIDHSREADDAKAARRASLRSTLDNLPRLDLEPEDEGTSQGPSSTTGALDKTMSSDVTTVLLRSKPQVSQPGTSASTGGGSGSLGRLAPREVAQDGSGPIGDLNRGQARRQTPGSVAARNIPEVGEEPEEVDWLSPQVSWDAEGQDWVEGASSAPEPSATDATGQGQEASSTDAEEEPAGVTGGTSFGVKVAGERKQRMRATRRRVLKVCAIALVVAGIAVAGVFVAMHGTFPWWTAGSGTAGQQSRTSYDAAAQTAKVRVDDTERKIKVSGKLEAIDAVRIEAPAAGKVTNLAVSEGSVVAEGEMLCSVVNEEVKRSVRTAESAVAASQKAVDNAQRAIDNAVRAYSRAWEACNAKNDFSDFDEAGLNAAVADAEAVLDQEEANLEAAQQALADAKAEAEKLVVRAPCAGTICGLSVRDGEKVNSAKASSQPLMEVADITRLKLTSELDYEDALFLREGQEATVTFEELPGIKLEATVSAVVAPQPKRNAKGEALPYTVELEVMSDQPQVRPYMEAKATIFTDGVEGAFCVPFSSVVSERDEGGETHSYVYAVVDAKANETERVEVRVLARSGDDAVIVGDVEEGETVMLNASLVDDER